MSTRRIMVATDGSAGANRAVEAAAGLAKDLNADLTIATFGGSFSSEQIEQLRRTEGQVGEAVELLLNSILRDAKERAERIGAPKIRIHSEWGDAAQSIIDAAARKEIDMVVVGRRGRGQLRGLIFGSAARARSRSGGSCASHRMSQRYRKPKARVTRIERDGARAAEVIDRLRSFYRKGSLDQQELVDVNQVIREMAALLRDEAAQSLVVIRLALAGDIPKVIADRVQLQQVLMNLMINAIEAMKETAGALTVGSQLHTDGQLLISISDEGGGFRAENAESIFDSFYTTGMGLAITRSLPTSAMKNGATPKRPAC